MLTPAHFVDRAVADGHAVAVCGALWGRLELIEAMVDWAAPCRLTCATFIFGPRIAKQFLTLLDSGKVTHFRLLLDELGAARMDVVAKQLVARADTSIGAAIHAKFDVVRNDRGALWCLGSMNTNKRIRSEAFAMGTLEAHAASLERAWEVIASGGTRIIIDGEVHEAGRGRREVPLETRDQRLARVRAEAERRNR